MSRCACQETVSLECNVHKVETQKLVEMSDSDRTNPPID